jgi:chemotaxis protein MotB
MAGRRRSGGGEGLNAWPGYVDALSTLLMVIIFVLLVFVLAQAFLSVVLSHRNQALDRLNHQLTSLSDMLSMERAHNAELRVALDQASRELKATVTARDALAAQLALAAGRSKAETEEKQAAIAQLQAAQQQLTALSAAHQADQAAITQQTADLVRLTEQVRALTALRDQLQKQAQDAAARAVTEAQARAAAEQTAAMEKDLGDSARAKLALLSQQIDQLRAQLAMLQKALDISEAAGRDKDVQIANLGARLNAALAQKVQELERYRSDFFGELRKVLAGRPGISIVGDRFVFQSEVLFASGSADLTPAGVEQVNQLAATLKQIMPEIPPNVPWILRVDGHTDRRPVTGGPWGSNWELSAGRAITVVKLLIADGIPPNRLAATGFGDTEPLDPANTPQAYAKNRRIEFRLTDR